MTENIVIKTEIDGLTVDKVSVLEQKYIKFGETEYPIEPPFRIAFENSIKGREELRSKVEKPYLSAILAVWGDTPTIEISKFEKR